MEWIFTASGDDDKIKKRFDEKSWPIYHFTRNRNRVKTRDLVVIYHAGANRQNFVGNFTVDSDLKPKDGFDYYLDLKNSSWWENKVPISTLVPKLTFIKNKNFWGASLQNGVVTISKKDYDIIISQRKLVK